MWSWKVGELTPDPAKKGLRRKNAFYSSPPPGGDNVRRGCREFGIPSRESIIYQGRRGATPRGLAEQREESPH